MDVFLSGFVYKWKELCLCKGLYLLDWIEMKFKEKKLKIVVGFLLN